MRVRRRRAEVAVTACASALTLLLVGCGGSDSQDNSGAATPSKSASKPPEPRPVPVQAAAHRITWEGGDGRHPVKLEIASLKRGSEADLADVELSGDLTGSIPYYLTVTYTNVSKEAIDQPDLIDDFSLTSADGETGERIALMNTGLSSGTDLPSHCESTSSGTMPPGGTAEACVTLMLPKKATPAAISYLSGETRAYSWKVKPGKGADKGRGSSDVLEPHASAQSVWTDSDDREVPVRATLKSVRAGTVSDLSRFSLDADEKKQVPYYVTFEYRNVGRHSVLPSMQNTVTLHGASGQSVPQMMLLHIGGTGVEQCPETVPDTMLRPKGAVTKCTVHLLPKGDKPITVAAESEVPGADQKTWRVPEGI